MRKSIVVLIVAVLAVAAGAVVLSLSAPVLDEEVEYRLTSLYYRGQEISSQVDGDEVLDLLEQESIEPTDWLTKVSALEQRMDDMTEEYRRNQMKRMKQGSCSDEACIIFSELLTDFERIGDHATNIAEWVIFSVTGVHKEG